MATSSSALARLRSRQAVFGIVQTMPVPTLTEVAVWCGFDFVILDCEHGVVDETAQIACLQALSGSTAFGGVRVRRGDLGAVGRYLDLGAEAILMPDVESAEEAAAFVAAATCGRGGRRSSTGSARARRYGLGLAHGDRWAPLFALIESAAGVANVAKIAATAGIDGLVVGPSDLSADLGCENDFAAPSYATALAQIEQAAADSGLLLGTRPHPGYPAARLIAAGHTLILASADIVALREGFKSQLAAAKEMPRQ